MSISFNPDKISVTNQVEQMLHPESNFNKAMNRSAGKWQGTGQITSDTGLTTRISTSLGDAIKSAYQSTGHAPNSDMGEYETASILYGYLDMDWNQALQVAKGGSIQKELGLNFEVGSSLKTTTDTFLNKYYTMKSGEAFSNFLKDPSNDDWLKLAESYEDKALKHMTASDENGWFTENFLVPLADTTGTSISGRGVASALTIAGLVIGGPVATGITSALASAYSGYRAGKSQAGLDFYEFYKMAKSDGANIDFSDPKIYSYYLMDAFLQGAIEVGDYFISAGYRSINNLLNPKMIGESLGKSFLQRGKQYLFDFAESDLGESFEEFLGGIAGDTVMNNLRQYVNETYDTGYGKKKVEDIVTDAVNAFAQTTVQMLPTVALHLSLNIGMSSARVAVASKNQKVPTASDVKSGVINSRYIQGVGNTVDTDTETDTDSGDESESAMRQEKVDPIRIVQTKNGATPATETDRKNLQELVRRNNGKDFDVIIEQVSVEDMPDEAKTTHINVIGNIINSGATEDGSPIATGFTNDGKLIVRDEEARNQVYREFGGMMTNTEDSDYILSPFNDGRTTKIEVLTEAQARGQGLRVRELNDTDILQIQRKDMTRMSADEALRYGETMDSFLMQTAKATGLTVDEVGRMWEEDPESLTERLPDGIDWESLSMSANFMPLASRITGQTVDVLNDRYDFDFSNDMVYVNRSTMRQGTASEDGRSVTFTDDEGNTQTFDVSDTDNVATSYASMSKNGDGRYTLHINRNARPQDLLEEVMHMTRSMATPEKLEGFRKAYGQDDLWTDDIKDTGDGRFLFNNEFFDSYREAFEKARVFEERFVDDFMTYLATGESPNAEISGFFENLKRFLRSVIDLFSEKLSEDNVRAFEKLLSGEVTPENGQSISDAVNMSETTLMDDVPYMSAWEPNDYEDEEGLDAEGNRLYAMGNGYDWSKGMSVNAVSAYEQGEMPLSKWSNALLDKAIDGSADEEVAEILKKLPAKIKKNSLLWNSSWHHTGKRFNRTEFYSMINLSGVSVDEARDFSERVDMYTADMKEYNSRRSELLKQDGYVESGYGISRVVYEDRTGDEALPEGMSAFVDRMASEGHDVSMSGKYYVNGEKPVSADVPDGTERMSKNGDTITYEKYSDGAYRTIETFDSKAEVYDWIRKATGNHRGEKTYEDVLKKPYLRNLDQYYDAVNSYRGNGYDLYSSGINGGWNILDDNTQRRIDADYDSVYRKYVNTDSWMKAPNGNQTNLSERQWVMVRTPAFKSWFGDWENDPENASKVVDENGEPLVVYHGTRSFGFDVFNTDTHSSNMGSHFGTKIAGEGFAYGEYGAYGDNPGVYQVFLNIRKLYETYDWFAQDNNYPAYDAYELANELGTPEALEQIDRIKDHYPWVTDENADEELSSSMNDEWDYADDPQLYDAYRKILRLSGYDGIRYENWIEDTGSTSWVVLYPNQIKSATNNTGAFDTNNDSILYSIGYHGSGADFERFMNDFIGSARNGSDYGYGIYVSGSDSIAKDYARMGAFTVETRDDFIRQWKDRMESAKESLEKYRKEYKSDPVKNYDLDRTIFKIENDIGKYERLISQYESAPITRRNLYKLDIPDNNGSNYLDWDTFVSISDQQKLYDALYQKLINEDEEGEYDSKASRDGLRKKLNGLVSGYEGMTGKSVYGDISSYLGNYKKASEFMNENGYAGITYTVPSSALPDGMEGPVRNYVIFNPNDIKIIEHWKYDTDKDAMSLHALSKPTAEEFREIEERAYRILDGYEESERNRVSMNLEKFKGTPWYVETIKSMNVRQDIEDIIAGKPVREGSFFAEKRNRDKLKCIQKYGVEGLFRYLTRKNVSAIAGPSKCVNAVNSSLIYCNPSMECAKFCYVANGNNYQFIDNIAKSEFVSLAVRHDPIRMANMIAEQYKRTADYKTGQALRMFDKGDFTEDYVTLVNELNVLGITTQIFSKRPEQLSKIDRNRNIVMLSIDKSNRALAEEYPDMPLAIVYSGVDDIAFIKECKERFEKYGGAILPVKLGNRYMTKDELKLLPQWARVKYTCPIDAGIKKIGQNHNEWNCLKCDLNGTTGCFYKRSIQQRIYSSVNDMSRRKRFETARKLFEQLRENEIDPRLPEYELLLKDVYSISHEGVGGTDASTEKGSDERNAGYSESTVGVREGRRIRRNEYVNDDSLFSLSPERQKEYLDQRSNDIRNAVERGIYVRTEYIEAFRGEEWADRELQVRDFMKLNPDIVGKAKEATGFDDFMEKINAVTKKDSEELDFDDSNGYPAFWDDFDNPKKKEYENEELYENVYYYARVKSSEQKDREFAMEWTSTEDKTLKLARTLANYDDIFWKSKPRSKSHGYWYVKNVYGAFKGVSTKVLRLKDGRGRLLKDRTRSTSEEIREAQQKIIDNPRPYRMALSLVDQAGIRADAVRNGDSTAHASESVDWMRMEMLDDDIDTDMRKMEAESEKAPRKTVDHNRTTEFIDGKIEDAKTDIRKYADPDDRDTDKTLGRDLRNASRVIERNREKIDSLNKEIKSLNSDLRSAEKEYSDLIERLGGEIEKSGDTIDRMKTEETLRDFRWKRNQEFLRNYVRELKGENSDLSKKVTDLTDRIDSIRNDLSEKNKELKRITLHSDAIQRYIDGMKSKLYREHRIEQILRHSTFNNASMDASFENVMAWVQNVFTMPAERQGITKRISALKTIAEQLELAGEDSSEVRQKLLEAKAVRDASNMIEPPPQLALYLPEGFLVRNDNRQSKWTAEELDILYMAVRQMREDATAMLSDKKQARMSDLNGRVYGMFRNTYGREASTDRKGRMSPLDLKADLKASFEEKTFDNGVSDFMNRAYLWYGKIQRLARIIDGDREGLFYDWFVRKAWFCQTDELSGTNRRLALSDAKWNELGMRTGELNRTGFSGTKINGTKYRLSRDQMIAVYVYSQNELGLAKLTSEMGNGIRQEDVGTIIGGLTDAEKAWGDFMVDEMDSNWQRLADVYYEVWNSNLGKRDRYFPFVSASKRIHDEVDFLCDDVQNPNMRNAYIDKSFTKLVNPNALYPLNLNATATWNRMVRRQEHFVAYGKWSRDSQYMLSRGGLGDIIRQKFGENMLNDVQKIVDNIISVHNKADDGFSQEINKWLNSKGASVIVGSVSSTLKQFASAPEIFTGDARFSDWISNGRLSREVTLRNFLKANKELASYGYEDVEDFIYSNAPDIKNRKVDFEVLTYLNRVYSGPVQNVIRNASEKVAKYSTDLVDKLVVERLWLACYYTQYENNIKEGMTQTEAHDEARFRASQFISETQNSNMRMDLSAQQIDAQSNVLLRMLSVFTNQAMNIANQILYDIPLEARKGTLWKKGMRIGTAVLLSVLMESLISGKFIRKGDEDDDEYMERLARDVIDTVLDTVDPIFLGTVGEVIQGYDSKVDVIPLADTVGNMVRAITDRDSDRSGFERMLGVMESLGREAIELTGTPLRLVTGPADAIRNRNPLYMVNSTWGEILESYR